jgi:heme-degrading monooxygenase HmoA
MHARVWEYEVAPEQAAAFERTYGPWGDWVRLFNEGPGYLRTELYRDRSRPGRYVTIDWWASEADWRSFRARRAGAYEDLDRRCAELTTREAELGSLDSVG